MLNLKLIILFLNLKTIEFTNEAYECGAFVLANYCDSYCICLNYTFCA